MKKNFCDGCGEELTRNYVSERLKNEHEFNFMKGSDFAGNKVKVEVMAGVNGTCNSGDLCLECLYDAVTGGQYSHYKHEAHVWRDLCRQLQSELKDTQQKLEAQKPTVTPSAGPFYLNDDMNLPRTLFREYPTREAALEAVNVYLRKHPGHDLWGNDPPPPE